MWKPTFFLNYKTSDTLYLILINFHTIPNIVENWGPHVKSDKTKNLKKFLANLLQFSVFLIKCGECGNTI